MAERTLTAGAQRAIARAGDIVRAWAHAELLPAHLLWSLLMEESEAFELLTGAGLTLEELKLSDIWNGQYPVSSGDEFPASTESGSSESGSPGAGHADGAGRRSGFRADSGSRTDSEFREDGGADAGGSACADDRTDAPCQSDPDVLDDAAAALSDAVASALAGVLGADTGTDLSESREWQRVLLGARQAAARQKPPAEVSTAHLLTALLEEPTAVTPLLRDYGIVSPSAMDTAGDAPESEAVAVSFEIDWGADPVDRTATLRILDASANRLREGLRVVEDYVRFVLDDAHLSELVKTCRHRLRAALESLDAAALIASRDTRTDVGTAIHTPAEQLRSTPLQVATASLKRAQEAARTLEEYSKLLITDCAAATGERVSQQLEALRYELYTLEKVVVTTAAARRRLESRRLYLLLTADLCRHGVEATLREAISGGVDIVQLREKSMPDRELLTLAKRIREITHQTGTLMIMNDRPDLAVLCDADGVHVGQEELSVQEVRRIAGPDRLVGVSTHSIQQAQQAVLDGASYLGVGPVFPSGTKVFDRFAGLASVRAAADGIPLPWFPIGGITPTNLPQVVAAGATRAAVCGAILQAQSPGETARFFAGELQRAARC